jgi:D-glycero-alpha-D-manno-heptose-7-phosphate kinase
MDYPFYYYEHGGSVLSTTINHYGYINLRKLPPYFDYKYSLRYSLNEICADLDCIQHDLARECLSYLEFPYGIEMTYSGDIPASSGIASRSSFCVGFLHALYSLQGKMVSKRRLAVDAMHIERDIVGDYVGSQDQVIASFGGFNLINFATDGTFDIIPVTMSSDRLKKLNDNLLFFYTGIPGRDTKIAADKIKNNRNGLRRLSELKDIVNVATDIINSKTDCFDEFGKLLHESWMLKKSLDRDITNTLFDDMYQKAISSGAIGGKLCGAGSGGFFLFYVPVEKQENVIKALDGLLHVPFRFENSGSQIIFFTPNRHYH